MEYSREHSCTSRHFPIDTYMKDLRISFFWNSNDVRITKRQVRRGVFPSEPEIFQPRDIKIVRESWCPKTEKWFKCLRLKMNLLTDS